MSPMPISRKQAMELKRKLPVNRIFSGVGRGAKSAARMTAVVRTPPVPAGVEKPAKEKNVGANYDTKWARTYPARLFRLMVMMGVMRPVVNVFGSPTIVGTDRLRDVDGAVIFAANHHSHADTPLMMTAIPEPWRNRLFIGAAADYWFTNPLTSRLSALIIGAIPVERQRISRKAIDQSIELLKDGWSMLIFPEGARSPDGWARPFTAGAAFLSAHANVSVVPVYIQGTNKVLPKGRSFPKPSPTFVVFGTPLMAEEGEDTKTFAKRIQQAVSTLADETSSDWWQARLQQARGETPSLAGPSSGAWRRKWAQNKGDKTQRRRWPNF